MNRAKPRNAQAGPKMFPKGLAKPIPVGKRPEWATRTASGGYQEVNTSNEANTGIAPKKNASRNTYSRSSASTNVLG